MKCEPVVEGNHRSLKMEKISKDLSEVRTEGANLRV